MEEVYRPRRREIPWTDGTSRSNTDEPGSQKQQIRQGIIFFRCRIILIFRICLKARLHYATHYL